MSATSGTSTLRRSWQNRNYSADNECQTSDSLLETLLDYHARGVAGETEAKQVVHLKRILGRMGEVNLTAIREYDDVSDCFEYLMSQRADLEDAIAQLEEAIERINKTTRERFRTTFEQVNERFNEVFPRLLCGVVALCR